VIHSPTPAENNANSSLLTTVKMKSTFTNRKPSMLSHLSGVTQQNAEYETPRGRKSPPKGLLLGISRNQHLGDGDESMVNLLDDELLMVGPLTDEELFMLSDMRLKEIFASYCKAYAATAGKAMTFEKISKGYESLN